MGDVVELAAVRKTRRVDDLCAAVAVNDGELSNMSATDLCGSVHARIGELNFHWTADEAEEFASDLLKAVRKAREER